MKEIITIKTEFIKLDQLLKYAAVVQTGGHAKEIINEGLVLVNEEQTFARGKKIRSGDIVKINLDEEIELIVK
ncbi:RNA-binding S4 domain-containing protein [Abyssisolibacter fermentans]|uniref:RNA-binding S4 domain-containing protein n=1 Tax=Abyssisolibacter fermentans TaxID=1766203 RepID=UPI0008310032|nr:RNA-binding S4 domain-containing protein [Abyssisolibacter fermentans]